MAYVKTGAGRITNFDIWAGLRGREDGEASGIQSPARIDLRALLIEKGLEVPPDDGAYLVIAHVGSCQSGSEGFSYVGEMP
jgi:hypothetical protein